MTVRQSSKYPLPTLLLLALGTFATGTDAFVLAPLIPQMSTDLHISVSTAGHLVTVYAVVYAITAPLIAALTGSWNRRRLLITAQLVFTGGMLMQAMGNAMVVGIGRGVAAIGAAGYASAASAVATMLVARDHQGRALAVVYGGMTTSTVLGVPLGVLASNHLSWRVTLAGVAGLGVIAAFGALAVPALRLPALDLRTRLLALRTPGVPRVLAVTTPLFAALFCTGTYLAATIVPVVGAATVPFVMVTFGVAGWLGNNLGGRLTDRYGPLPVLRAGLIGLAIVFVSFPLLTRNPVTVFLIVLLWGLSGWCTIVPQQSRLIGLRPELAPVLLGWNASALYIGVALGSLLGGTVVGTIWLGPASAVCVLLALTALFALPLSRTRELVPA